MFNWDYGPSYQGGFNALDTAYMSQTVNSYTDYLQYDVTLINKGAQRSSAIQAPTFYFTNRFRQAWYPSEDGSNILSYSQPDDRSGIDSSTPVLQTTYPMTWISFADTSPGVSNNYITVAGFQDLQFASDKTADSNQWVQQSYYHTMNFYFAPSFTFRSNVNYHFRYVVFPFRFDEVISTKYGSLTVAQTISAMRAEYQKLWLVPRAAALAIISDYLSNN
jgi:hypothetical protein